MTRRGAIAFVVGVAVWGAGTAWMLAPDVSQLGDPQWAALQQELIESLEGFDPSVFDDASPSAEGAGGMGQTTPLTSPEAHVEGGGESSEAEAGRSPSPPGAAPSATSTTPVAEPALAPSSEMEDWATRRAAPPDVVQAQRAVASARRAPSVVELQGERSTAQATIRHARGFDRLELVNLNPAVGAWYVLTLSGGGRATESWHLSLEEPADVVLRPAEDGADGLLLERVDGRQTHCSLFSAGEDGLAPLDRVTEGPSPYRRLCDGAIVLRRAALGRRTSKEWATDFLRDKVKGGEKITVLVRSTLYADAWRVDAKEARGAHPPVSDPEGPPPVPMDPARSVSPIVPQDLGLRLDGVKGAVWPGQWRAVEGSPGVWASALTPAQVDPAPAAPWKARLGSLEPEESSSLVYLAAFDLSLFELGFALGTDHPRVGWSDRALPSARGAGLAGPDGFADLAPLQRTGVLPAADAERVAATFTAGFKRSHGAFKHGDLAARNSGSHYGFVEQGVVSSALQPGLSTLFTTRDGGVHMRSWREEDASLVPELVSARQNGVPLVQTPPGGQPEPGELVSRWGAGNWGGSQDEKLRTVRAGACMLEAEGRRWLVYGWFSSATPGAMARVFLAQGCTHAMLLDMNALEHTYLALYDASGGQFRTRHLVDGMKVLDREVDGQVLPRFLAFSDNRDFFYLLRRTPPAGGSE